MAENKKTCNCPICGNSHPVNDDKILKRIQERMNAQKQFGNFIVVHRSHVKDLDDNVFFHCKSVRSAKYELAQRINNMKVDPNDWSQHLDFVFVAEPVVVLYQKKEESAQIDISTILGKITFSKSLIKELYWKADYHGLDCGSSDCSCKEKTHKKLFTKITNCVKTTYNLLFKLLYQTETVPANEKLTIWDQFHSIEKMLDSLFEISEEHGFIGTPPACSCTPEAHFEMETQIEETLDKIIKLLE